MEPVLPTAQEIDSREIEEPTRSPLDLRAEASTLEPIAQDLQPTSLEGFHVLRELGQGGMGTVYLAFNTQTRKQVALKVLAQDLAADRVYVDRFYREARIGESLHHKHIVRTIRAGRDGECGRHFMELEHVDGPSCQYLLERDGRFGIEDAVLATYHIAQALAHMHDRMLVHRDVKPDNILLTAEGIAKLADFGLAKEMDATTDLTAQHAAFGSSWYMPYEQARNAGFADARSDIFSLGASLYHMVTGTIPFPGENHAEVVARKQLDRFVPASRINPQVPPALDAILNKMLAFEPRNRFASMHEFIIELECSRLLNNLDRIAVEQGGGTIAGRRRTSAPDGAVTSPDLRFPESAGEGLHHHDAQWRLRFRDGNGRDYLRRATTGQVLDGLRNGYWPGGTEAARSNRNRFRPLREYPEFRDTASKCQVHQENFTTPSTPTNARTKFRVVMLTGFGIGLLVAATMAGAIRVWLSRGPVHTPLATTQVQATMPFSGAE